MTSAAALVSGFTPRDNKVSQPYRRNSSSSVDSDDSSNASETPISYATDPERPAGQPTPRTTKQKVDRRPPSTFHLKKRSEMSWAERLCDLATCPTTMHELKDDSIDRGPPPIQPAWKENVFVLTRGMVPIVLHQLAYWAFPQYKWPFALAYPFYVLSFIGFALQVMDRLSSHCVKLGTFDEKQIGRDRTPDKSVKHLAYGVTAYMFIRTGIAFWLDYDKNVEPLTSFTWTYPLRLAAWELTLDYFFYVYHRASHEIDSLWFIHQHHHTTKHPTAILAILAEEWQEVLEVFLIPFLSSAIVPMTFSEGYMTLCYTIYVEMMGHSGVRAHWCHPVLWPLETVGMGLAVEDHDLHHRFGKSGKNYGKQSRVWDRVFGTCAERIETYGM
ncbi:hypothetical protein Rhopal_006720-T1 [Rhodotorula paludigena]|uniref:Fatty acid hydroxylase domain-containing protein n=1 Tax=Rhodotorula paludigena TaxID=86838 RepID=A0AAV5GTW6_9BASI|nr:hypothetical protein Rhopal_006720-T1 [Rhodotorula paludigena]